MFDDFETEFRKLGLKRAHEEGIATTRAWYGTRDAVNEGAYKPDYRLPGVTRWPHVVETQQQRMASQNKAEVGFMETLPPIEETLPSESEER